MIINAEFLESRHVAAAVLALKQLGVADSRIDVYSARPLEFDPGVLERPSRMSLFSVGGAILWGSAITAFMFYAQLSYPLMTGSMPLTSGWATGVITFEATMGGAVLATALMFLKESGLLSRKTAAPAPVLRGDEVVVQLTCGAEEEAAVRTALRDSGADRIEAVGESV